jgi:hypothetical protein
MPEDTILHSHCRENLKSYIIGIVGKVDWNTFVESVTISYLACVGTVAPNYGVVCIFRQISSVTALATDVMTDRLLLDC